MGNLQRQNLVRAAFGLIEAGFGGIGLESDLESGIGGERMIN
jgi:hypothetical protein